MEEYGVPESWTRKFVIPMKWVRWEHFFGCTNNGELLINNATGLVSIDPESQNQNILAIEDANWVAFSASMESLVLLDGDRESERKEEEEEKNSNVCSMDDLGGALSSVGGLGSSSSGLGSSGDGHSRVTS
ncbi:uncharacterized protein LOC126707449 [Quercus robur]|uniref:uncharacterized protein LOC126707449 n=1 Tax=Quercus robur TaxID=38942 RepID=UPI0021612E1F|nr:uncharacterized protein LOC126707449 [Quercus robur]